MINKNNRKIWVNITIFALVLLVFNVWLLVKSLPEEIRLVGQERPKVPLFTSLKASNFNKDFMEIKFLGLFTIKQIEVKKIPVTSLIPGGHSIGVYLKTPGVMIVGFSDVKGKNGEVNPAGEAGLKEGDLILKVNDIPVSHDFELKNLVNHYGGQKVILTVKRGGQIIKKEITPVYSTEDKRWRIGIFIRDNIAGLGTLSYYNPVDKTFGALGHTIIDPDTGKIFPLKQGRILAAKIQTIYPSKRGQPGEKIGIFLAKNIVGTVYENNRFGIFGKASRDIINPYFAKPLPIASNSEVKPGEAEIYTVLKGEKIEKFTIYIEKVRPNQKDGRNLIIRIKDPRLLRVTGGIVQGMSGSPIIQNGKIAGVVTHVFLSDSSKGYGILIENMLKEVYNNKKLWGANPNFSCKKLSLFF